RRLRVRHSLPTRRSSDLLVVRPGERIATDGIVRAGRSSLDTSAITGESIPVDVESGDEVSAGAINTAGVLEITTTAAGLENSLTDRKSTRLNSSHVSISY